MAGGYDMSNHIDDYSSALANVAKAQAKAILSSGEGFKERLESLIQVYLKCRSQDFILASAAAHELLANWGQVLNDDMQALHLSSMIRVSLDIKSIG
jgi:hypothetical protein